MLRFSSRGICVLACLLLLFAACSGDGKHGGKQGGMDGEKKPEPVTLVEALPVTYGQVSDTLIANAIVESESQADIYPSATGIVLSVHKDEGDSVKRGSLLAIIDNIQLDASAERAQAEMLRLVEQVASTKRLHAHGAASQRELEELEFQLATASTNSREAAKTLGQTRLSAPFAGVVAARELRVGELTSSAARAFQIVDLDHLRVVASLPERDLSRTKAGQSAKLISAYDPEVWAIGAVDRIAPVIDPNSGTFRVTISVKPGQNTLRPGQFVSVELVVDQHEDVLV
ncbi:MAG: efflux RND transporter periplasmic adaptor subunit, partial [Proteobacteria bacterium]|nr:efflux RND transporter periplasmic adaptor subunit [Pseudomonadota bacterium]